ncbi:MAG: transcription termination/antitermination NusG family protein [Acidobacteria bacterium]|nr:transcription termination/antitermination NusG family protein [Acidobacteriota bacterium]
MLQHATTHATGAAPCAAGRAGAPGDAWYAVWTQSHFEHAVHGHLAGKGLHVFLPTVGVWTRRRGARRVAERPVFPGYLFVRDAMDRETHLAIRRTPGVVRLLGERWDRLSSIPDEEMQAIRQVVGGRQRIFPFPYLREGQRARVATGPLAGLEGVLAESREQQGLLVLSLHLLQRSIAVTVDGANVVPA